MLCSSYFIVELILRIVLSNSEVSSLFPIRPQKAHPEREGGSVSYPGERTLAVREESMKKGIHVDEAIWKQLCSLASGDMSTTDIASK